MRTIHASGFRAISAADCGYWCAVHGGHRYPGIFTLENYLKKHYDLADWARSLTNLRQQGGDFIGCSKVASALPLRAAHREKLKGVAKAFGA